MTQLPKYLRNDPRIFITPEAKTRLDLYIGLAIGEISGLGLVTLVNKQDFYITEVSLLKQTCTFSDTVLNPAAIGDYMLSVLERGGDPAKIKLWWHSHADMAVFWSADTDETTIDGFKNGWMLSLVGNKNGQFLGRVDIFDPVRVTVDNLQLTILLPQKPNERATIQNEIDSKVTFVYPPEPVKQVIYRAPTVFKKAVAAKG